MKLILLIFVSLYPLISFGLPTGQEYYQKYDGHTVYQVITENENDIEIINNLEQKLSTVFDYWSEANSLKKWTHIMVRPEVKIQFEEALNSLNLKYSILIKNVGDMIRKQLFLNSQPSNGFKVNDFEYGKYHTLDEISDWMNSIEQSYPKYVTVFNVSRSYQQRDIYAMKISIPNASKKPAIWFDGGIHAREWISPATVIHMTYLLLSNYSVDPDVTEILNTFDIYVLPVFNVDGYEYTWVKDRMWRKTRSKTRIPGCYGADPNRNWDTHFCENGASKDPCSDTYCGEHAFSESEIRGVADFLLKHNDTIVSYINFHSYSQLWMSPWGYVTKKPPKFNQQDGGSIASVTALSKLYGTQYQHGNIASTIYLASGSSVDWAYDVAQIVYSYAVELRDQGEYGFLLPPEQIIPSGLETFEALKALGFYIKSQLENSLKMIN